MLDSDVSARVDPCRELMPAMRIEFDLTGFFPKLIDRKADPASAGFLFFSECPLWVGSGHGLTCHIFVTATA